MKISRRELRKIIAEAIGIKSVPLPPGEGAYQELNITDLNPGVQSGLSQYGINSGLRKDYISGGDDKNGILILHVHAGANPIPEGEEGGGDKYVIFYKGKKAAEFTFNDPDVGAVHRWQDGSNRRTLYKDAADRVRGLAGPIRAQNYMNGGKYPGAEALAEYLESDKAKESPNLIATVSEITETTAKKHSVANALNPPKRPRQGTYDPDSSGRY